MRRFILLFVSNKVGSRSIYFWVKAIDPFPDRKTTNVSITGFHRQTNAGFKPRSTRARSSENPALLLYCKGLQRRPVWFL